MLQGKDNGVNPDIAYYSGQNTFPVNDNRGSAFDDYRKLMERYCPYVYFDDSDNIHFKGLNDKKDGKDGRQDNRNDGQQGNSKDGQHNNSNDGQQGNSKDGGQGDGVGSDQVFQYLGKYVETSDFTINSPHGNYTLYLRNGDGTGKQVKNGTIFYVRLNGQDVFTPLDYYGSSQVLKKKVNVSENNTLQVFAVGAPGSFLSLWLEDESPDIVITSPYYDRVSNGTITLAGYTADRNVTSVNITQSNNNTITTIPVFNGNFSTSLWIQGPVKVTVSAVDSTGTLRSAYTCLDGDYLSMQGDLLFGFDPMNPDSNSSLTSENLTGQGIPNGFKIVNKAGGEKLPAFVKYMVHGDPLKVDSNGNGLTDYFEVMKLGITNVSDTSPEAMALPNQSPNRVGLTNLEAQRLGVDPLDPPLNTSTVSNQSLGINVSIMGMGDLSQQVNIIPANYNNYANISPYLVSPLVNVSVNAPFDHAVITMNYDPTNVTNSSSLYLCYFNESMGMFVPVTSHVDTANHTISANVFHLSIWGVFGFDSVSDPLGNNIFLNYHSQNWPYDVMFTDGSGAPLNYWIESSDDNTATVWVKTNYIPASPGTANVNVYYGKSGDNGNSNGDGTFVAFDHFDGSTLDSSKWQVVRTGSATVSNSNLQLSTYGQNTVLAGYVNNIGLSSYVIETSGRVISPYVYQGEKYRPGVLFDQTSPAGGYALGFDTWAFDVDGWSIFDFPQWSWHDTTSPAGISPSDAYNGKFHIRITVNGPSYTAQELLRNKAVSGTTSLNGQYFSLIAEKCTDAYDWVFVRQYTPNEPKTSWLTMELPTSSWFTSDSGYSWMQSHSITGSPDGDLSGYQIKYVIHKGIPPIYPAILYEEDIHSQYLENRNIVLGAIFGMMGMPGGYFHNGVVAEASKSIYYALGWVLFAAIPIPGPDTLANIRDFVQCRANGDTIGEALFGSGIALSLVDLGAAPDAIEAIRTFLQYNVDEGPRLIILLADVLKYCPDSFTEQVLRLFDDNAMTHIMDHIYLHEGSLQDVLTLVSKGASLQDISTIANKAKIVDAAALATKGAPIGDITKILNLGGDLHKTIGWLNNGVTMNDIRNIFFTLNENGNYIGTISKTIDVVKSVTGKTTVMWMEEGGSQTGWIHIENSHIINPDTGNQFAVFGPEYTASDPNYLENIQNLIMTAAKNGDEVVGANGRIARVYSVETESGPVILNVGVSNNGYIITAYPKGSLPI